MLQQTATVLAFSAAPGIEINIPDASVRKEPFGSKLTIELDTSLVKISNLPSSQLYHHIQNNS